MADNTPVNPDLNTIAYDAPLSFPEPSPKWIHTQNRKGAKGTHATVPDADLRGNWVIISGSNNGIGREAALKMASWGANLILACRDPPLKETHPTLVVTECRAAARISGHEKSQIEWWELDCASLASVEAFAQRWLAADRPLDILCNNAGIGSSPGGAKVFKTADGFEIIHQVRTPLSSPTTTQLKKKNHRSTSSPTSSSPSASSPPSPAPPPRASSAPPAASTTSASSTSPTSTAPSPSPAPTASSTT